MKKLSILFLSAVALTATFTSCSKDENKTITTPTNNTLVLTVSDFSDSNLTDTPIKTTLVPNAKVDLYASLQDFTSNGTPFASKTADANGVVTFTGLKAQDYYFFASDGSCGDNGVATAYAPFKVTVADGVANKSNALIIQNIGITFNNPNAKNFLIVYSNGTLNGNSTDKANEIPFGGLTSTNSSKLLGMPLGTYQIIAYELNADGSDTGAEPQVTQVTDLTCGSTKTITLN